MPNENQLTLPLLITRGLVVFPSLNESIDVGRPFSVAAVDYAKTKTNSLLIVTTQKEMGKEEIEVVGNEIYLTGTLCRLTNVSGGNGTYKIRIAATKRVEILSVAEKDGLYMATVSFKEDIPGDEAEEVELVKKVVGLLGSNPSLGRDIPRGALNSLQSSPNSDIANTIAAYLPLTIEQKEAILSEPKINDRLKNLLTMMEGQKQVEAIDQKLNETVRERAEQSQKEYFLREKMKAIKDELGEGGDAKSDVDSIKEKIEKNPYPENIKAKVKAELHRFEMMPEASLEASLILSYIETLLNVPWFQKTEDNEDLVNCEKILDEDHYGLKKVKQRIIEYLAVKKTTGTLKAPILCFYGPPGCGKTSLAKSIARALGRKFFKASLGGISDEAEIRGHRRTYVGSMPGRIIQGMTRAGVTNPVFLLDEIDKIGGASYRGDPSSALLEVLDPEQNCAFNDNFLEEPYDLSSVLFICTANYIENVPEPLLDRLELIEVPSYTELEKIKIADGFLVKKQEEANGLKDGDISFGEDGIKEIIERYTREAGVRQLERSIASISRKAVVSLLKDPKQKRPIIVNPDQVHKYLGVTIFDDTQKEKEPQIGVVTGMAYTEYGGDILPIETTYFKGKGNLILTGKLGDVMKESARIALDYVHANAEKYGIEESLFERNDIHIHVPEGAVPKDGPSAGVALTIGIISSLAKLPVDNNVAMTGEVTLRGNVLAIGGLREKSLAALRSGIKTIIVPEENRKDVAELPEEVRKDLKIIFMKQVDEAVKIAFLKAPVPLKKKAKVAKSA